MTPLLRLPLILTVLIVAAQRGASDQPFDQDKQDEQQLYDGSNHVVAFEKNRLGYEKIEEFLQYNVPNERAHDNVEAALKLQTMELSKPGNERDLALLAALEKFVALRGVESSLSSQPIDVKHVCNHKSYMVLNDLHAATNRRAQKNQSKRGALRRIELVLAEYSQQHALKCRQVYPRKFEQHLVLFPSDTLTQIDDIMKEIIGARLKRDQKILLGLKNRPVSSVLRRIYKSFMQGNDSLKTHKDAKLALKFIRQQAAGKPVEMAVLNEQLKSTASDEAIVEQRQQIKALVSKYLLLPCKEYNKLMGPDIFVPAQSDAVILNRSDRVQPNPNGLMNSFVLGWIRYGYCSVLRRDSNILNKNITKLVIAN